MPEGPRLAEAKSGTFHFSTLLSVLIDEEISVNGTDGPMRLLSFMTSMRMDELRSCDGKSLREIRSYVRTLLIAQFEKNIPVSALKEEYRKIKQAAQIVGGLMKEMTNHWLKKKYQLYGEQRLVETRCH